VKLDNLTACVTVAEKHNIKDSADELGLSASGVPKQLSTVEFFGKLSMQILGRECPQDF
jgi:hypothetical protein